jgi:hypothetical protein
MTIRSNTATIFSTNINRTKNQGVSDNRGMQFATGEMANEDRIFDEKCEGKKEAT